MYEKETYKCLIDENGDFLPCTPQMKEERTVSATDASEVLSKSEVEDAN
jgi:hypothetical protein